jgi:hypothetical protein
MAITTTMLFCVLLTLKLLGLLNVSFLILFIILFLPLIFIAVIISIPFIAILGACITSFVLALIDNLKK